MGKKKNDDFVQKFKFNRFLNSKFNKLWKSGSNREKTSSNGAKVI